MKGKQTQFLVLGLGRFGESVARSLCELGRDVLAVDNDPAIIEAITPYVTQAVEADVTDENALAALGVADFDAAVVSTGDERSSILVVALLKELGVKTVLAKASDELHARVLKKIGADRVIFPERETGQRVAKSLISPNVMDLMQLSNDYQIVELALPEQWDGHTIGSLDVRKRYGLNILAVRRGETFVVSPAADATLLAEDILLVLGQLEDIEKLSR